MKAPASRVVSELRKTLNLVVDSAIVADDAIVRNDFDALNTALSHLEQNLDSVKALAREWKAAP